MRRFHLSPSMGVSLAALVVAGSGAAYAASSSSKSISACVHHRGGGLYVAHRCARHDKRLKWGVAGPPGVAGAPGSQGPPGPATGAAGGALTGSYPNPGLAPGAADTGALAAWSAPDLGNVGNSFAANACVTANFGNAPPTARSGDIVIARVSQNFDQKLLPAGLVPTAALQDNGSGGFRIEGGFCNLTKNLLTTTSSPVLSVFGIR